jgi:hypothetical protein
VAVFQARASDDYQPGNEQWRIGVSSMFVHAMGVAPFKDNFWTTQNQTGNIYGERYIQWVVSAWSEKVEVWRHVGGKKTKY